MALNRMCTDCAKLGRECSGTTCQTWTGCVYREEDKDKRIFNSYKRDLIRTARKSSRYIGDNKTLRFNCIQYVCSFPEIDPIKMAASLQNDGFTILFDDSSISAKENTRNRAAVNRAAKEAGEYA